MEQELSRKQRRRLERQAKKAGLAKTRKMNKNLKSAFIWIITATVIIAIVWGLAVLVKNNSPSDLPGSDIETDLSINETDWTKGNPEAGVQIIEYSDFQCPACQGYTEIISRLVEEYADTVYFAYRHYPLNSIHPHAQLAAQAAEAAGIQGKFWEMHDKLFETQATWSLRSRTKSFFIELAEEIGLDIDQFESDLESTEVTEIVLKGILEASQNNLSYTPSFIINGQLIQNPRNFSEFQELINELLINLEEENVGNSTDDSEIPNS